MSNRSDQSYIDQAKETVNDVKNRVSQALQPGDAKSTAQELPPDARYPQTPHPQSSNQTASAAGGSNYNQNQNQGKGILQSAQETVSKALGADADEDDNKTVPDADVLMDS